MCGLINLTSTRSAVVPRTIVAFSLFYSTSIAAGRSSFVIARYYGNATPLCHSVVSSTRSCGREESESKERRDGGYRVDGGGGDGTSVSFLCNHSILIFHHAGSNLTPSIHTGASNEPSVPLIVLKFNINL